MSLSTRFGTLALAGLMIAAPVLASGGAEVELSRRLAALHRDPRSVRALTDVGAGFAFRASERGFPSDVDDARKYVTEALAIEPNNAVAQGWLGAIRLVEAKIRGSKGAANEGLRMLDRAYSREPGNPLLMMLRGSVDVELPRDFNRLEEGVATLEKLTADPAAARAARVDMAVAYMKLAKGYRAKGDITRARQLWQKVVSEDPRSAEADSAKGLLR